MIPEGESVRDKGVTKDGQSSNQSLCRINKCNVERLITFFMVRPCTVMMLVDLM